MQEKILLTSTIPFDVSPSLIEESVAKNNGKVIVRGLVQRANSMNENHRFYPKLILEREVEKYQLFIKERRSVGELDHPDSSVINLKNASHLITELHWDGDDLIGVIEILPTPSGNILKALFSSGVRVGISSRGLGTTKDIGNNSVEVCDDFEILCWDMVSNPSTQGAFMQPVVTEGVIKTLPNSPKKYDKINNIVMDILTGLNKN